MNHEERNIHIQNTGEWWIYPWWEKSGHYDGTNYSFEEINNAIKCVKNLFTADWYLQNKESHSFITYLNCMGIMFLLPLVSFGLDLDILLKKQHLVGNLLKRLKQPKEFEGAKFELSLLAHLIKQGFAVTRDSKASNSNKNSDFCVKHNNETVYFELKNIKASKTNRLREQLFLILGSDLMRSIQNPFDFHFTDEFRDYLHTKDGLDHLQNNYENIKNKIIDSLKSSAENDELGHHDIEGLGTFYLYPAGSRNVSVKLTASFL